MNEEPPNVQLGDFTPELTDDQFRLVYDKVVLAAQENFVAWLYFMWPQQEGQEYNIEPVHAYLAQLVQDVLDETRGPRQSVSMAPQHGKSRMLAVRSVAWLIGKQPGIHIALTGYSQTLINDFLREIKAIVASPQYQEVFPGIEPQPGYNRANAVSMSNGSNVQCRSAGAKLTGRPVDWLIIDDPHAGREEAESATQRNKVINWYKGDCRSRLSDGAKIFIISTRWHPNDLHATLTDPALVQTLIDAGMPHINYEVTNLTALCDDPDNDVLGRGMGEALAPRLKSQGFMEQTKVEMQAAGGIEWESQFMGRPVSLTGGAINVENVQIIQTCDIPWDRFDMIARGWDLATTETNAADFSVGVLGAYCRKSDEFYILHVWRRRAIWPKVRPIAAALARDDLEKYGAAVVGVEGVAGFKACVQDLRNELLGEVSVKTCNPPKRGGKLLRALPWLNKLEASRLFVVNGPWLGDYLAELTTFPDKKHKDDQVDGTSACWEMVSKNPAKLLIA